MENIKWNKIETAPKDGTEVIVLVELAGDEFVHKAWYRSKEEWEQSGKYCGGWDDLEEWEGWWSYVHNTVSQEKLDGIRTPVAWIPMPNN